MISAGGVGSLVGSVFASRVVNAIGLGPAVLWMALGSSAIGALIAAAIAESIGIRTAIAVGWAGMALSLLFIVFSPIPRVRSAESWLASARSRAIQG